MCLYSESRTRIHHWIRAKPPIGGSRHISRYSMYSMSLLDHSVCPIRILLRILEPSDTIIHPGAVLGILTIGPLLRCKWFARFLLSTALFIGSPSCLPLIGSRLSFLCSSYYNLLVGTALYNLWFSIHPSTVGRMFRRLWHCRNRMFLVHRRNTFTVAPPWGYARICQSGRVSHVLVCRRIEPTKSSSPPDQIRITRIQPPVSNHLMENTPSRVKIWIFISESVPIPEWNSPFENFEDDHQNH